MGPFGQGGHHVAIKVHHDLLATVLRSVVAEGRSVFFSSHLLDEIEYLLSAPSWISVAKLRVDPRWSPLLENPRLRRLLEEHGG